MSDSVPYGSWSSPLNADEVASAGIDLGHVVVHEGTVYWLERRPDEGGRGLVARTAPDGPLAVTPDDHDVRTLVHEYGGGDFTVVDGQVVYSRFEDGRLYQTTDGGAVPLTPDPAEPRAHRYAAMTASPTGTRLYCVRERHETDSEVVNELITLPIDTAAGQPVEPTVVAEGADFYSAPRLSPDGDRIAWLTWNHPQMPWDGTQLHVGTLDGDGRISESDIVLGGPDEAVCFPTWGADGTLYAVSDRTGWWNVYALEDARPRLVREERAEFGAPQWVFGMSTLSALDDGDLLAVRNGDMNDDLGRLDPETGEFTPLSLPGTVFPHPRLATDGNVVATVVGGPATPPSIVRWQPEEDTAILRQAFDLPVRREYISTPEHVTVPTDGTDAHALYYPPTNPMVEAPENERPPLIVKVHGGPTSQTRPVVDPEVQYFTTRGMAVVDVNYRGSTGYGRAYREALNGEWGVVDTADCVAAAESLASREQVDPDRLAIRGGSAGGYAALCALAFHETFDAGVSYYGVADLRTLAAHTHKFESRYLDGLVGPLPEAEATYEARSPIEHADRIRAPLLILQGGEDRVVPPAQAERLVNALVASETPYGYLEFPDERHGFRTAKARRAALAAEFGFYAETFGFDPADDVEPYSLSIGEYHKQTVEDR